MNVVQINQSDVDGGAAIACWRLHRGLLDADVDSKLLVGVKATRSSAVVQLPRSSRRLARLGRNIASRAGLNYVDIPNSFVIPRHPFFTEADVINLHNLHTGYFNYLSIPLLSKQKPTVWTLHDQWSFTGHCAYSLDCERWHIGCGSCPQLSVYPAVRRDATAWEWRLKKWIYRHSRLTIITPSSWLAEQARQSILGGFEVHWIPNGLDLSVYTPVDQASCRAALGIPVGQLVILFAAQALSDPRKGGRQLFEALGRIPEAFKQKLLLLTIGRGDVDQREVEGIPTINLGFVASDRLKAQIFSAADVFVFPTIADNLPLVLQESMACGTPMVASRVGGVPELVRHGETGFLADPHDPEGLAHWIVHVLTDRALRLQLSANCRRIAVAEYSVRTQVERYLEVYRATIEAA